MDNDRKSDFSKVTGNYYIIGNFDFYSIMKCNSVQGSNNGKKD